MEAIFYVSLEANQMSPRTPSIVTRQFRLIYKKRVCNLQRSSIYECATLYYIFTEAAYLYDMSSV